MNTKKHTPSRCIMSVATWGLALLAMSGLTGCADSGQGGNTGQGGVASPVAPPTQHYAYVANQTDDALSIYKIDTTTGKLEANGSVSVLPGNSPTLVAVDPSNRFAYVANSYSHNVSAYLINTMTGALTPIGAPVGAGLNPTSLKVDPTGRFLYVANQHGGVSTFHIDSNTGVLTSIGPDVPAEVSPHSVAVEPTGRFVYVASGPNFDPISGLPLPSPNDIHAFSIHATTGVLTPVGVPVPAPAIPVNITVDPSGKFAYVASGISSSVTAFAINNTTGTLTLVGTLPTGGSAPRAVAVESSGRFAYVVNVGSNNVSIFSINATAGTLPLGALTPIPVNPVVAAPGADARFLTVDATGKFVYVTYFNSPYVSTFSINAVTGELTHLGTEPTGAGSVGITVTNAL